MAVRSRELRQTFGVDSTRLHRWHQQGLITPLVPTTVRCLGAVWPDWTWRMVALLCSASVGSRSGHSFTARQRPIDVMRAVAATLATDPDVPWVAIGEDGVAHPCYSAAEVLAVHTTQICATTVIAIPEAPL